MGSSHSHGHAHGHQDSHGGHSSGGHATVKLYVVFFVILAVITFVEWYIFKVRVDWGISAQVMIPALLGLSLVKFIMVVGWYMHLRYDHSWLIYIFIFSLLLAGSIFVFLNYLK